jgi:sigma-B regulation protein RsbU (phosphoserine phosphatase)
MPPQDLASIPLFASLPIEEIDHLKATLADVHFLPGKVLIHEGRSDDRFYVLLEGEVEVVKSLDTPEERVLGVRGAGNLLGEMSLFSHHGNHTASVRSLTPLHLLQVTRNELDALLHRQPQLAYEIIRLLSHRLAESENITILDLREKNQRLREAYDELKAAQEQIIEKEKLEKELEISRQIQRSILPEKMPNVKGYDFGALMIPARAVGGDFYTFFKLGKDKLGIVVGDVSDKGVPAALFMALSYSLIRAEAIRANSPVIAFRKVNHHLLQMNSSSMFVTLVYGILDCNSGDFHYARAAHPAPYLLDGSGAPLDVITSTAQPLGLFDDLPIDEKYINLPPGGLLILFSDGITETSNASGREFGLESINRVMTSNRERPAQEICDILWKEVKAYGDSLPQHDDFTAVVIKRSTSP